MAVIWTGSVRYGQGVEEGKTGRGSQEEGKTRLGDCVGLSFEL